MHYFCVLKFKWTKVPLRLRNSPYTPFTIPEKLEPKSTVYRLVTAVKNLKESPSPNQEGKTSKDWESKIKTFSSCHAYLIKEKIQYLLSFFLSFSLYPRHHSYFAPAKFGLGIGYVTRGIIFRYLDDMRYIHSTSSVDATSYNLTQHL